MCQARRIPNKSKAVQYFLDVFLMYASVHTCEKGLRAFRKHVSLPYIQSANPPLNLRAQCVDTRHSLFEAVQEVFGQTVPVAGQTLPVLQNCLHAEPGDQGELHEYSAMTKYRKFVLRCVRTHRTNDLG